MASDLFLGGTETDFFTVIIIMITIDIHGGRGRSRLILKTYQSKGEKNRKWTSKKNVRETRKPFSRAVEK